MDVFPPYPGKIVRFDYDPGVRSLRAFYRDGSMVVCNAVPPSLIKRLTATLTPEEFFSLYIASQYNCEIIAARTRRIQTN
ncbi:MAG TPA: hypothetical protein VGC55_11260 [Dokdonella sp.]